MAIVLSVPGAGSASAAPAIIEARETILFVETRRIRAPAFAVVLAYAYASQPHSLKVSRNIASWEARARQS